MKKLILARLTAFLSIIFLSLILSSSTKAQEGAKKSCFDLYLKCAKNCVDSCRECETTSTGYQMCGTDFKCSGSCIAECGNAQRNCEREEESTGQPLSDQPTPATESSSKPSPSPSSTEPALPTKKEAVFERVPGLFRLGPGGRDIEIPSMLVRPEDVKDILVAPPIGRTGLTIFLFDEVQGDVHLLLPNGSKLVPKQGEQIKLPLETKFIVPDKSSLRIAYAHFGPEKSILGFEAAGFDSAMEINPRSQLRLTEMVRREEGRFGAIFKVEEGLVRVKGRGAGKLPLGIASETGVMLGTKGTDFAFAFDKKKSLTIIEIYDGEVEVTNPQTNKTTTLASSYGKEIKRLEIARDGTTAEKIAVPQNEFYKEKILSFLLMVIIFAVALGGIIRFVKRKEKRIHDRKTKS